MPGRGYGRRGRKKLMRFIGVPPPYPLYGPPLPPQTDLPPVDVLPEEIEAMRLVDLLGLTQEEAAHRMGISKRAFWEDLKSGRRKVIQAIIEGRPIRILPAPAPPPFPRSPPSPNPYEQGESLINEGKVEESEDSEEGDVAISENPTREEP